MKNNEEIKIELNDNDRSQWVDDSKVSNCKLCQKKFSFFRRRHHCRKCFNIFCDDCITKVISQGLYK